MVFSSMMFLWIFLPIVFLGYICVGKRFKNIFLLLASLLFYAWGDPICVVILLFSIIFNYLMGLLMNVFSSKGLVVFMTVFVNLALLGYFKYFDFFMKIILGISGDNYVSKNISLPLGISFFTFQAMSYVIDVYRKECPVEKNPLNVALYITLFPQLIAGPIVKYKDISEQMNSRVVSSEKISKGIRRFIYGLGKKVIISNILAECVDKIANLDISSVTGSMAWIVVVFYTLQIYYDFSGYSDMAIGLGQIFGFDILENFNYPYMATSIREFWQKWHISLSSWFKDYLYIPLGGNKKGTFRTYLNLIIVFFFTGLWHGASWNFIIWGLYHGIFSIIERIGFNKFLKKHSIFAHIYTIVIFAFGWLIFRFENITTILEYAKRLACPWIYPVTTHNTMEIISHRSILITILGILGAGPIQFILNKTNLNSKLKNTVWEMLFCIIILLLCFSMLTGNTYNPFIYFRF